MRYEIGNKLNINPKNVHSYVIGEHGDTELVPWSNATIGLSNLNNFLNDNEKNEIETRVRNMAYEIIKMKGNTSYGIGMVTAKITNAILSNENTVLTISSYDNENDLFIGYPTVINENGAIKRLPFPLNDKENEKYNYSIKTLKDIINNLK